MAISTKNTHLYYYKSGTTPAWTEIVPDGVKTVPSLFGEPESLETTTLSNDSQTYIPGVKKVEGSLAFTFNYDFAVIQAVAALGSTTYKWLLVVGGKVDNGALSADNSGAFTWDGVANYGVSEFKVNGVAEATLYVSPSTEIAPTATIPTVS